MTSVIPRTTHRRVEPSSISPDVSLDVCRTVPIFAPLPQIAAAKTYVLSKFPHHYTVVSNCLPYTPEHVSGVCPCHPSFAVVRRVADNTQSLEGEPRYPVRFS